MMGKTHVTGGLLAGMTIITLKGNTSPTEMGLILCGGALGSLVPDLDHGQSKLSNANLITKAISTVICAFTTHRNATHTLLACIIQGVIGYLLMLMVVPLLNIPIAEIGLTTLNVKSWAFLFGISMLLGGVSHLVWDAANKEGVPALWPVTKKRFKYLNITTSSMGETIFATIVHVILIAWIIVAVINMEQFEFMKIFKVW